jgi:CTP synthase (UTP-ammonia lyase)
VLDLADADTEENASGSRNCVVTPLSCALPNRHPGGPKASGEENLRILTGTKLHSICGKTDAAEQYYCNYGVNESYEPRFAASGMRFSARGARGELRAVELPRHRFFLATLFQPQLSSRPESPHPLLLAFLREARRFRRALMKKKRRSQTGSRRASRRG